MKRKRNLKTKFLLMLRQLGMLCKTPAPPKKGLRLSKTLMPDGTVIMHDSLLDRAPTNPHDLDSQIHVFHEVKKLHKK
jgi:hypothetical protein